MVTILRPAEDLFQNGAAVNAPENQTERPFEFRAAIVSLDEPVMKLRASYEPAQSSALKIETPEALWLGETEHCVRSGDEWLIQVRLKHVLRDFETLAILAERFKTAAPAKVSVRALR